MNRAHKILYWLTLPACLIAAASLAGECLHIYLKGAQPVYDAKSISPALIRAGICALVFALLALAARLTGRGQKSHPKRSPAETDMRLEQAKRGVTPDGEVLKLEKMRAAARAVCAAVMAASLSISALYMLDSTNFVTVDFNEMILGVLRNVLPGVAVALAFLAATLIVCDSLARKETELLKRLPRREQQAREENRAHIAPVRIALLIAALIFILHGAFNDGALDVLKKALAICMECIGIG